MKTRVTTPDPPEKTREELLCQVRELMWQLLRRRISSGR